MMANPSAKVLEDRRYTGYSVCENVLEGFEFDDKGRTELCGRLVLEEEHYVAHKIHRRTSNLEIIPTY